MNRRTLLLAAITASAGMAARAQQRGSSWPEKPIHLIVPYAAGGPTDVAARLVADAISRSLPHRVIVENVTGAGTVVGTARVAGAPKDGHVFLVATVAHAVSAALYTNLPFDPTKDFDSVALIGTVPQIVLVNKESSITSLSDLFQLARSKPQSLSYGSAGVGSAQHLAAELLRSMAKIDILHVPYRGSAPAVTDLIGGRIDLVIDSAATALPHISGGSARALAVTTQQRLPALPHLPTVAESLPGYEAYTWNAILAPAGVEPKTVAAMNAAINAALDEPNIKTRLEELGITIAKGATPDSTKAFVEAEMAKWQPLLRSAGITSN
jgi:tripartite-type tricarboxylate transporter receptor subunit TctC